MPCILLLSAASAAELSSVATVNVKSVFPETLTFCTITSTSISSSLIGLKMPEAIPGVSTTP